MRTNILQARKALLALFAMLMPLLVGAQTKVEIDGIWYNLVSKIKQAEVTNGDAKYSGSITIPATVTHEGVSYSVTSIGNYTFEGCSSLTAINIPESVTSIGDYAFRSCSSLTAINIPENSKLTSIEQRAFAGCSSLVAITIPEGVTSIGDYAFSGCKRLTAINIPESVTTIGKDAFQVCSNLTAVHISDIAAWCNIKFNGTYSNPLCCAQNLYLNGELVTQLTLPESVTSIGEYAFADCSSLTAITIPESVTSIGNYAFSYCSSLTTINIPESVTSIGVMAFYYCNGLTAITIPEGVTSIGNYTFEGCSSLTAINIPESVTSIGDYAFRSCSSLTTITIPEGVTSIGNYTFEGCSSLTAIVLPKNLKKIGSQAFANCAELLDVYCYAESVPSASSDAFTDSYPEYATLHVPASALNAYKTTAPWSSFGTIVALGASITDITLSQSSATLYEGESLALTAAVTPSNADMNLISWSSSNPNVATVDAEGKIIAVSTGTATITVTANDGSGVSASCVVEVKEKLLGKCATPVVSYVDGKVVLTCETEEATIVSVTNETTEYAVGECEETEFDLIPTYTITAYATKSKYENSDEVTLTLCWVPCTEEHESEDTGILTIPSKPVLISARDGVLTLSGLVEDTAVALYTTDGAKVAQQQSSAGEVKFTIDTNQVYLVHIGDKVVKIGM